MKLILSLTFAIVLLSNFNDFVRCSESHHGSLNNDLPHTNIKRHRITPTISESISSIDRICTNDPLLEFCNEKIPHLSACELSAMFDEAVSNEIFGIIKLFHFHGIIAGSVHSDHIESLCRSKTAVSNDILEFFFDFSPDSFQNLRENLFYWLTFCVKKNVEKFKLLWTAFDGKDLSIEQLAEIISRIAAGNVADLYEFVMNDFVDPILRKTILKLAMNISIRAHRVEAVHFFLEFVDFPVFFLDLNRKMKLLKMAVTSNDVYILKALLNDVEVCEKVCVVSKSPWNLAVHLDLPEIVDVFLKAFPRHVCPVRLVALAFADLSEKVLEYFKETGVLTETLIESMAQTSIHAGNLEAFIVIVRLGLDARSAVTSDNVTFLTLAVESDSLRIVQYLLDFCGVDPNAVNILTDDSNVRTSFSAIYSAKTPKMVHLLSEKGADVNVKYVKETINGELITSTTALHKAASTQDIHLFRELISSGADITISDDLDGTNEEFYYRRVAII